MGLEEGLTEYKPRDEIEHLDLIDGTVRERVQIYQRFEPGQCYSSTFKDQQTMEKYIARLRQEGLDIGKGDAEFGFKMPLPGRNVSQRTLVIFRRHL